MEITEVKVFPIGEEKLKAFVSVVFDRCFMVNDIKIIHGREGLFISMPSRKKKNGEFKDVAHPLNNETRRLIENEILGEYERVLAQRGESLPAPPRSADGPARSQPTERSQPRERPPRGPEPAEGSRPGERRARPEDSPAPERDGEPSAPPPRVPSAPSSEPRPPALAGDPGAGEEGEERPSLEEVQEIHLRDSFWSVS